MTTINYTTTNTEIWKDIPGHPGYQVSNNGRVRSLDRMIYHPPIRKDRRMRGKILSLLNNHGYLKVILYYGHAGIAVHRLVTLAFLGPCPEGLEVCHNDGIKTNNHLGNLRYGTRSDNRTDDWRHHRLAGRQRNKTVKLTENDVKEIRASSATNVALAEQYGVTHNHISAIRHNRRWTHN